VSEEREGVIVSQVRVVTSLAEIADGQQEDGCWHHTFY